MANILLNKVVSETTEKLYMNAELADVRFIFKIDDQVQIIPANKAILAIRSTVFHSMFFGVLKNEGDIEIIDCDVDAFREFLKFFYMTKVTISMENLWEVVRLLDMYDLIDHVKSNEPILDGKLTLDNVCWTYQLAVYLKHEKLIKLCENKIRSRIKKVFGADSFKRIDKEILKRILQLSDLECDEIDVFNGCLTWAKAACRDFGLDENKAENLKIILGDCLASIRFSEMELKDFTNLSESHNGLFTSEELLDIRLMLTLNDYEPKIFSQNPRRYKWNKDNILKCRWKSNSRSHLLENPEIIQFSSNRLILLGEIHGPGTRYDCFINVTITAYDQFYSKDSVKWFYEGEFQAFCDYSLEISLPQPIVIKPNFLYEIRLNIIDPYEEKCPNWDAARQTGQFQVDLENGLKIDISQRNLSLSNERTDSSVCCLCFNQIHTDIY